MDDPQLHEDVRTILEKTIRIETALWPSPGQPSRLEEHGKRLDNLETWRSWLAGAGAVLGGLFGIHVGGGK